MKNNNNVVTGRTTEGGTKFERGSRGGAEKESGWSSVWGLCSKIYLSVCSDPTVGPCWLWLLGGLYFHSLYRWQLCPFLALTSLLCSFDWPLFTVWPVCHLCTLSPHGFWEPCTWFFIVLLFCGWYQNSQSSILVE